MILILPRFTKSPPYFDLSIPYRPRTGRKSFGNIISKAFCYETSGIRTPDNLIKSQVLYQLS